MGHPLDHASDDSAYESWHLTPCSKCFSPHITMSVSFTSCSTSILSYQRQTRQNVAVVRDQLGQGLLLPFID